jgi:hypothetical protein
MFGLFKKKSKLDKLQEEYEKLTHEVFVVSKTNRMEGDRLYAKAEAVLKEIEAEKLK